ncbi:phosphomannomutase 1 isoform X2 [Ictidomys tridecemlineatus]|uniref:phosphomannomutase 1 isoform X2 n=1 Tax=Ictidomys tridecemlineatus TaxID=43179 RepID=UPI000B549322|nr:phosphomannomutase 1 isoform X2 [Ictidomys tridecemlineatus]KAG3290850.1 phosphomannomutase 1, transcript variant X2 [Ictidomys tridecemlineatus]
MAVTAEGARRKERVLCLFDVDGTLTPARQKIDPEVSAFLQKLRSRVQIGVVGGSDYSKIAEQLGDGDEGTFWSGERSLPHLRACVPCPDHPEPPGRRTPTGLDQLLPQLHGPAQTAQEAKEKIREKFVEALKTEFAGKGLRFSRGGMISFDVFPEGWDKRYCLDSLDQDSFDTIHFFGNETSPGGNDFEIYADPRTVGHSVVSPQDTVRRCKEIFFPETAHEA